MAGNVLSIAAQGALRALPVRSSKQIVFHNALALCRCIQPRSNRIERTLLAPKCANVVHNLSHIGG
jgi:hypothetical protein